MQHIRNPMMDNNLNEISIYQDVAVRPALEVKMDQETVWLNLN